MVVVVKERMVVESGGGAIVEAAAAASGDGMDNGRVVRLRIVHLVGKRCNCAPPS